MDRRLPPRDTKIEHAEPVLSRLSTGGELPEPIVAKVRAAAVRVEHAPARTVLQVEDQAQRQPRWLVSGWACRQRLLADGRRLIFDLVLPGEGVGVCMRPWPRAMTTTVALIPVQLIDAREFIRPEVLEAQPALAAALQRAAEEDGRRLLRHTLRLGRMSALERTADLFLELYERLAAVALTQGGRFPMPLTQEILSDTLGLSVVHVNRTLQELRRRNMVSFERGWVHLPERERLAALAGSSAF